MKIQINLMENSIPIEQQLDAVKKYINISDGTNVLDGKIRKAIANDFIEETNKDWGQKIITEHRNFHVSCKKTAGGTLKFQVWQAV